MSTPAEPLLRRHRLTVADYERMGEAGILSGQVRVELIDGEILEMPPIGSAHAGTVNQLAFLLGAAAREGLAVVAVQNPLVLGEHSEPQPDLMLLRPREDFYKRAHPRAGDVLLLAEVADASIEYDRRVKLPLYARHGVAEVWLLDLAAGALTTYRAPGQAGYGEAATPTVLRDLSPILLPALHLDLSALL
jgi:Uma2 family endonuclease